MLCSISTGKSGSKWLDRLRSSKGFPAGDDLDLEQFLSHHNPNIANSSDTKAACSNTNHIDPKSNSNSSTQSDKKPILDSNQDPEVSQQNDGKVLFNVLNNVLAELFNMGDSDNFPIINRKKSCRKQPNPRIFVVSTSTNIDDNTCKHDVGREEKIYPTLPTNGDNGRVAIKEMSDLLKATAQEEEEYVNVGEEEEKCHADLSEFSRTEVTVIDTSCPSWKFEKLLFRRKNVWKVRDKKSKVMKVGKKKRKASALEEESVGRENKANVAVGQCGSSKEGNYGEEGLMPPNEDHHRSDKAVEVWRETTAVLNHVPKKKQMDLSPSKLKKEGSSDVLIKSIPSSKKNRASIGKKLSEVF
ncbi:unnamed protein product [Ilex paraguariensis]|uniref:Uncharacterized protein n=1 Tax=Ilex paraguariensis TaxID=185542 RepID=A0ABC8RBC9_9AQUA